MVDINCQANMQTSTVSVLPYGGLQDTKTLKHNIKLSSVAISSQEWYKVFLVLSLTSKMYGKFIVTKIVSCSNTTQTKSPKKWRYGQTNLVQINEKQSNFL